MGDRRVGETDEVPASTHIGEEAVARLKEGFPLRRRQHLERQQVQAPIRAQEHVFLAVQEWL